jgi:subtilisin family serine protease
MRQSTVRAHRRRLGLVALVATTIIGAAAFPAQAGGRRLTKQRWERAAVSRMIVVLDDASDAPAVAAEHSRRHGTALARVYQHALRGYVADLPVAVVELLRRDPRVRSIEPDQVFEASTAQLNPPWGLNRIDQHNLPLGSAFNYTNTGAGVTAYIIDSGIRATHADFEGRVATGFDALGANGQGKDCNGHGTHVAGTVGGKTYGVAKKVTLVPVRVLNCSGTGSTAQVVAGVDWVTGHHRPGQPAVANMSLGGATSSAVDLAVRNSIKDGISYVVAAGNNTLGLNANSCNVSPARISEAMTIAATDKTDRRASFSNYGSCIDWFAPGAEILSASNSSDTATRTMSGTSMAAPHTAGVAALYLQSSPGASPSSVRSALFGLTTKGKVSSSKSTNNHLLYTNL